MKHNVLNNSTINNITPSEPEGVILFNKLNYTLLLSTIDNIRKDQFFHNGVAVRIGVDTVP